MDPTAEGDVLRVHAVKVEALGVRKNRWVVVGGADTSVGKLALPDQLPCQFHILARDTYDDG